MALILEVNNVLQMRKDTLRVELKARITIREYLKERHGPDFQDFTIPTICIINGEGILRKEWDARILESNDTVHFITLPGFPVWVIWAIVALEVVATVVLAIQHKLPSQNRNASQIPQANPIYSLSGQSNQVSLGNPIQVQYGYARHFPSYAAASYTQYINNEQFLYQLFCLGQGLFDISAIQIDDTPIGDFQEITYEVVAPGSLVTLFPDNVVTSGDVSNVAMLGPNQTGFVVLGPFICNPPGTRTKWIEVDYSYPGALYKVDATTGALESETVQALWEYQQIDDSGTPLGAWTTLFTANDTLTTTTPQRITLANTSLASGRYQVRGQRTNNTDLGTGATDGLQWDQMRAFLPSKQSYGNVTMIAVKAKATFNLNNNNTNKFNVISTRQIPVWNGTSWTTQTSRSLVWAFCDLFKSYYGGLLNDIYLNLSALLALDTELTAKGVFFDWIFDQRTTVWDAAMTIAAPARALPVLAGSLIGMVRDDPQTIPVSVFNAENIVKGSFEWDMKFWNINEFDGCMVTYKDALTGDDETVLALMLDGSLSPVEFGNNPEQLTIAGVTDRDQAYRLGMYRRAVQWQLREDIKFKSGWEGYIPTFGDMISVSHDVPRWGSGGMIKSATLNTAGTIWTLALSEPVVFSSATGAVMEILIGLSNGSTYGPVVASPVMGNDKALTVPNTTHFPVLTFADNQELPRFIFGLQNYVGKLCRVLNVIPNNDETISVECSNYDAIVYSFDTLTAPVDTNPNQGGPGPAPQLPAVTGLKVIPDPFNPNGVIASWNAVAGASYYVVQLSYDGVSYQTISDNTTALTISFPVLPKVIWVRVGAIGVGNGGFDYWIGQAPTAPTNVVISNGNTPLGVSNVVLTPGLQVMFLQWTDSSNTALASVDIFASNSSLRPSSPTYTVPFPTAFWPDINLPNNQLRYYWFRENSIGGQSSAILGPYTATTLNGVSLSYLVPGITAVEIVSTIPSSGNFQGRTVYLTADGGGFTKGLYRWTDPTATSGTVYWQQPVGNDTILNDQLTVGCVTAGVIQAGAVQAAAVGANIIITYTANIQDAVVTSAKIASVDAGTIVAGTIMATVAMASPLLATAGALYNSSYGTSSTFPAIAFSTSNFSGSATSPTGPFCPMYGWATGSGFALNRFGGSGSQSFLVSLCINVGGSAANLQLLYRVNGGSWTTFGPILNGISLTLTIPLVIALASTDTIEFGFNCTGTHAAANAVMSVYCFNM
jgi:hypothetical protein